MQAIKDKITVDSLIQTLKTKGYAVFENGNYNLNLVGIRKDMNISDKFDDLMCLFYKVDGKWRINRWSITTDPGLSGAKKPTNSKGVAILKPGQYRGAWVIGKHKGQYTALVQNKPLIVYRDDNRDAIIDYVEEDGGIFGINIHRSNPNGSSMIVGNWSLGCQVFQNSKDFERFMELIQTSAKLYSSRFTYTLIEATDLKLK